MSSRSESDAVVWAAVGAVMGIVWFIKGFKELKVKRTIQNIPTCKINTGAIGTDVEVKGFVVANKDQLVTAPISNKKCALYHLEIQELRRNKNSTYWATIDKFFSEEGFYLDDDSGANALVLVDGAEIKRDGKVDDYRVSSSNFDSLPPALDTALRANKKKLKKFKMKKSSWFFSRDHRFLEWCFMPDEYIYVLGFAESGVKVKKSKKPKMKYYLKAKKAIQENEKLKKRFDTNQDGKLDFEELERGARIVAQRMADKFDKEKVEDLISKTKMIFKKNKPHPFIISNREEEDLVKHLSRWSALKIWGGPILTTACSAFLVWYFTAGGNF